ncbi:TonB-dependent receptor [Parapedobacter composti]|nr:TonB-dependent receptor [Parapedobacter composti]
MKCSVIALIIEMTIVGLLAAHEGRSQDLDRKIRLNLENADIKESLLAIEQVGNVRFIIRDDLFAGSRRQVNLKATDITIRQAIAEVLANTPFIYQELDGFVAIINRHQQRIIQGKVVDADTKKPAMGVSVQVKGMLSNTAISNASGNFSIPIPAETATLVFSSLGYRVKEVRVSAADGFVHVELASSHIELDEVTVAASKRVNTEIALLEERRKAAIIQDGISAQQIDRTASITTTQALQRVTGVTVTDEKYVAVRGLGERSVIGQLNGVRLASSDPDRTTIPLDLVPAALLDNIVVYKTVTPDKPADAAAGIVELKTKSIPDSMTLEFIVETGTNTTIGFGGRINSFYNSDMGFWGNRINDKNLRPDFLALAGQYPNGLGSIQHMIANAQYSPEAWAETERINGIMRRFDPVMTTGYKNAQPNQLYSLTFGNQYDVFRKHKIGIIFGGNYYKRMTDIYQGELTQYSIYQGVVTGNDHIFSWRNIPNYITPNRLYMGRYQTYQENSGMETLNYGVLGGLTYRFNPRHEIGFQYLGSWGGENRATNMFGGYQYTGLPGEVNSDIYSLKQSYRTLNTFNMQGEHQFGKGEYAPRLSYNAATSSSSQNDPDYRFVSLATYLPESPVNISNPFGNPHPLYPSGSPNYTTDRLYVLTSGYVNGYGVYGRLQAEPNGRRWRFLEETNYNYKADLSFPFPFLSTKQELKIGFNYLYRDRSFTENLLMLPGSNYSEGSNRPLYRVFGDLDRLVGPEVVGVLAPTSTQREGAAPIGGFLYNSQKSPNNYTGFYETNAYYGMLDLRLADNFRVAGGVRFERTDIRSAVDTAGIFLDPALTVPNEDGARVPLIFIEPNSVYTAKYKPYYSVNATYMLGELMNLRGAFNTTLARPELREITNVFEFDAFQMGLVVGNPNLVNQHTKNLDFRWEWFPNPGEVLALSAFGKEIHNQLVRVFDLRTEGLDARSQEYPTIQYQNDPNTGYVWGIELELVKDLGTVWAPLNGFFLGSNLMLAQSQIKKSWDRYQANRSLDRNTPENSPLFEQPPYAFNGWLNYTNKRWGTDLTTTFNIVGERLVQINLTGEPDLYSRPVPMLDFVFTQRITRQLLLKGFAKNILDPAIKTVYSSYGTGGTWYGNEYVNRSYHRGCEIMLGLSYNFF